MSVSAFPYGALSGFPPLGGVANDDPAFDANSGFAGCGAVGPTNTPDLVPSGGSGSYSFSWVQTGTPAERGPHSINGVSTAQNPTWSNPNVCDGDVPTAENWTCTITDDVTSEEFDVVISVDLVWNDLS